MCKIKAIRALIGGTWLHVKGNGGAYWTRPTFPEAAEAVGECLEIEKYSHSLVNRQRHITLPKFKRTPLPH